MARIALVHDIAGVAAVQAQLLRGAGHEVDQIALPTHGATWRWPAKGLALPVRLAAFWPEISRLRRGRYDVIHIHFVSQGIVGVLARRGFFVQAHGSDLHVNLRNPAYRRVSSLVLRRAKAIFYVTPNLRRYLGEHADKLVYLPNPVVPESSEEPAPPSRVAHVLVFTRLHTVKGVARIFPAVERPAAMARVTALAYGPLAAELKARYGGWVEFVEPIPHTRVAAFLAGFDVVIGQMEQGVLGLMEIEAMAACRPVVAAVDAGLYAGDSPPVMNARTPEDIVAAVQRLREDPVELSRLAREGRAWAVRNHGYGHHLELLEAAYFGARPAE